MSHHISTDRTAGHVVDVHVAAPGASIAKVVVFTMIEGGRRGSRAFTQFCGTPADARTAGLEFAADAEEV